MNDVEDWLILLHTTGLGMTGFHKLLDTFKQPDKILTANNPQLSDLGLNKQTITAIQQPNLDAIQADIEWLEASDRHHIITLSDPRYPQQLKTISQPPPVLFVRGDPDYLRQPQLAMVGSRNPTAAGKRTATDFARHLSNSGITITSGLARGIDGASHQGALQGIAGTVALVAHGLDIVYPAAHRALAEEISQQGAVVSEVPIGTEPHKGLFPRRNRIISGLSLGTLIVEAALKSGSLITARHTLEQGREVFAIPGSIHNPLSRGCHQLIRQGAKLVETAEDITEELLPHLPSGITPAAEPQNINKNEQKLDPDHQKLLKCLQYEATAIDELVNCSGFSAAEVASMLLIMELEGSVVNEGGRYTRIK
ncbi:MAG: DNA-processing protein DprA [Gammaproteobacteria bacterium]|nr:DNA-processing protein DprA [Gammaproteobacteria bacterium]MCW8922679.1 DNA-processing protein DprA [Gammaproteobacteria bacterium]